VTRAGEARIQDCVVDQMLLSCPSPHHPFTL